MVAVVELVSVTTNDSVCSEMPSSNNGTVITPVVPVVMVTVPEDAHVVEGGGGRPIRGLPRDGDRLR